MASDLRSERSVDVAETTSTAADSVNETAANEVQEAASPAKTAADAERADLNLVSDSDVSEEAGSPDSQREGAQREDSERRGIPIWLALIGLVIAALVVGYQMRLAGQLEAEVMGLEAELGRTEAVLDAHKTHLGDIRGGVRDLSAQLQSLQMLVETEPVLARDTARDESTSTQP